jgi:hypothetical protein
MSLAGFLGVRSIPRAGAMANRSKVIYGGLVFAAAESCQKTKHYIAQEQSMDNFP